MSRAARAAWLVACAATSALLGGCGLSAIAGVGVASSLSRSDRSNASAPQPVAVTTPTAVQAGFVPIQYVLTDGGSQPFDVTVEVSTTGAQGTFIRATEAVGAPSQGTRGLNSSPAGVPHVFVWNSYIDFDDRTLSDSAACVVRITASTAAVGSGAAGGAYGSPALTNAFRVDNRLVSTYAGTAGAEGEGLPNLAVPLFSPTAAAVVSGGSILVADTGNHRLRRADATSQLTTTQAGTGAAGFNGDGLPTGARLASPRGVAVDPTTQNIVIADGDNHRVRRINTSTGLLATIAGDGSAGFTGDGGAGAAARLSSPRGLAVGAAGEVLVADTGNDAVRRIDAGGTISTLARAPDLLGPEAVALAADGTVWIANTRRHVVSRLVGGSIEHVVGTPDVAGASAVGQAASVTALRSPAGVALVGDRLFVADTGNHRIVAIRLPAAGQGQPAASPRGALVEAVAGLSAAGFAGDNGAATAAALSSPRGLAPDGQGGVLVADTGNGRLRRIDAQGVITTAVGSGALPAGFVGDGGPAIQGVFAFPEQIALASDGAIVVADSFALRIRRFVQGGLISTVMGTGAQGAVTPAGSGIPDVTGDGGPAEQARVNFPRGVAADQNGVVFVADSNNNTVRAVNPRTGITNVVAGTGVGGNGADGVVATQSQLNSPRALLAQPGNALLIADTTGHRIRRFTYGYNSATGVVTPGTITTIAGVAGAPGFVGDGGPAAAARLNGPTGLALDGAGAILVADNGNGAIRRFTIGGNLTTIAGTLGQAGFAGDGGAAVGCLFNSPINVAFDAATNLVYVSDNFNNRIRRFPIGGNIETVAGDGSAGDVVGLAPTRCPVTRPHGIVVDAQGNIVVAAQGTARFLRFKPGQTLEAVAGQPPASGVGDGGPSQQASFKNPFSVAPDAQGTLFLSDSNAHNIRVVDRRTGTITKVGGNSVWGDTGDQGPGISALFGQPFDMHFDAQGNIYVADKQNNRIRRIANDAQRTVTTVAGTGVPGFSGDGGPATAARINQPNGVYVSPTSGAIYICEFLGSRIRRVDPVSGVITTVAGLGGGVGSQAENVAATAANVQLPSGIAMDPKSETIYVAEFGRHRVRKFTVGGTIVTVAGVVNNAGYNGDNILGTSALMSSPSGVDVDALGNVYVAEAGGNRVRKVDPNGFITTILGTGVPGSGPDGVLGVNSRVSFPSCVRVDRYGNIYVAEFFGNRIRRLRNFP